METMSKVAGIGMDVHRRFSKVTARGPDEEVAWRARLAHTDRQALRDELGRWPVGTPVVLEGSFGWSWLADELVRAGLQPHLASTRKVAAWRQFHGLVKCDRNDSDLLSRLAFQSHELWEVWLPPAEVRERRELLRHRMALVHLQTGVKNRIHALLHRHGLFPEVVKLFGPTGRRWLQLYLGPRPDGLPDSARQTLKGYLQLLDHLRLLIAGVTRVFRRQVTANATARRLCTLPGVKWILAYTLLAEIGRIERFASARKLVSYSLLAPRANDTGEADDDAPIHGRHVGHQGRRTLKWAYIEAAHSALYRSPRLRRWFDHYTRGGRQNRNRGYIGVARRLCQQSYAIWKREVDYQEEPPPRPGRVKKSCRTRPAQGQPAGAMVTVAEV